MKKDIIINFIVTLGISVSLFLINKYFAIYLGIEKLGLMKLFTQMLAYLNLAEIGLASASAYSLYKPLVEKNTKKISIIFNTMTHLYNRSFFVVLVVGLFLNIGLRFIVKGENIDIYIYWSLYVLSTALNYTFIKYSVLFTADQKYSFVRLIEGGSRILCQSLQLFVIAKFHSFLIFILVLMIGNFIQYIFYKMYYKKYYNYIFYTEKKDKTVIISIKNLFWHKIAGLIVFNTDLILISKFLSLEIVGIYASYQMIIQMLVTIINIFLNVLKPKIGKFIAENSIEHQFELFKKLNILLLFISIIFTFCSYKLINDFIFLWLGENFVLFSNTVVLILINLFIRLFRGGIDIFKENSGFFDDIHLPILEASINFVVSLFLVKKIGLNGVIIGTICSNIIIICIAKPILVFKKCFKKNIKTYIKLYGNYLLFITFSFFTLNIFIKLFQFYYSSHWNEWILKSIFITGYSIIINFLIFSFNKDFRNFYIKTINNYIKKKFLSE